MGEVLRIDIDAEMSSGSERDLRKLENLLTAQAKAALGTERAMQELARELRLVEKEQRDVAKATDRAARSQLDFGKAARAAFVGTGGAFVASRFLEVFKQLLEQIPRLLVENANEVQQFGQHLKGVNDDLQISGERLLAFSGALGETSLSLDDVISASDLWGEASAQLMSTVEALRLELGVEMAPVLADLADAVREDVLPGVRELIPTFVAVTREVGEFVTDVAEAATFLFRLGDAIAFVTGQILTNPFGTNAGRVGAGQTLDEYTDAWQAEMEAQIFGAGGFEGGQRRQAARGKGRTGGRTTGTGPRGSQAGLLAANESIADFNAFAFGGGDALAAFAAANDEALLIEQEHLTELAELRAAEHQAQLDRIEAEKRAALDSLHAQLSATSTTLGAIGSLFGTLHDAIVAGYGEQTKEAKRATTALFLIQKGFALGEAVVNAAQAVSEANASAPPPYNIPAIAAAAAVGAAQVATITATTIAGVADEGLTPAQIRNARLGGRTIIIDQDERVLSAGGNRDFERLVGRLANDLAVEGRMRARGGGGVIRIENVTILDGDVVHRSVEQRLIQDIERGDSFLDRARAI